MTLSDLIDFLVAFSFAVLATFIARSATTNRKLPKWWFWIALVPLLSLGMALAVMLFPRPIPDGWQEGDFDTGRADFVALVFFGVIVPTAYLLFSVPIALAIRFAGFRLKAK